MSRRFTLVGSLLGVSLLVSAAAPTYAGGPKWGRPPRIDADIESLQAQIRHENGGWRVAVRYDVELEGAVGAERLALALTLLNGSCPVLDRSGRPVSFNIPLVRPALACSDEARFRDEFSTCLPGGVIGDPRRLRVRGEVVRGCGGAALDDKVASVKWSACGHGCNSCDRLLGRSNGCGHNTCGPNSCTSGERHTVVERRTETRRWNNRRR